GADAWHRGQQLIALSESTIGGNHLGQALVEEADIGLQSHLAAFAEPPEHGIFEMSRLVLGRNMLVTQLSPHGHDLGEFFDRSVTLHNAGRHDRGPYPGISRAWRGAFLASTPRAGATGRSLFGWIRRPDSPAASRARMIPRSYPPLGSRPIAETASGRNLTTSSAQPAVSLLTEKNHPSGSTTTSKRSFDTSIPQKE